MPKYRFAVTVAVSVAVCALLSACGGQQSDNVPMPVPTQSISPSASPTQMPEAEPTLLPGGTALANKAYFDFVNSRLLAINANPSSDAIVENLLNSGFSAGEIEVTPDKTSQLRRPADSIEFSVKTSEGCLLGQFQAGAYSSLVGPALESGTCLIGSTKTNP